MGAEVSFSVSYCAHTCQTLSKHWSGSVLLCVHQVPNRCWSDCVLFCIVCQAQNRCWSIHVLCYVCQMPNRCWSDCVLFCITCQAQNRCWSICALYCVCQMPSRCSSGVWAVQRWGHSMARCQLSASTGIAHVSSVALPKDRWDFVFICLLTRTSCRIPCLYEPENRSNRTDEILSAFAY